MARAHIYIDAQNFSIACLQMIQGYVDVKAFARMLAKKFEVELGRVYYYDSPSPDPHTQSRKARYWERLREARVVVRTGRTESNHDGTHREKECDVMLAVDMITDACDGEYDLAILVTGDTDQAYTVEAVQERGLDVGWAYLTTQQHIDRLKQVIRPERQLELSEKVLRPVRQQSFRPRR